jgi:hypothetical protein
MKVLVLPDGKTARKKGVGWASIGVCIINGLYLKRLTDQSTDKFYSVDDRFFKIACPPGTEHEYETLPDGKINLL